MSLFLLCVRTDMRNSNTDVVHSLLLSSSFVGYWHTKHGRFIFLFCFGFFWCVVFAVGFVGLFCLWKAIHFKVDILLKKITCSQQVPHWCETLSSYQSFPGSALLMCHFIALWCATVWKKQITNKQQNKMILLKMHCLTSPNLSDPGCYAGSTSFHLQEILWKSTLLGCIGNSFCWKLLWQLKSFKVENYETWDSSSMELPLLSFFPREGKGVPVFDLIPFLPPDSQCVFMQFHV